MERGHSAPSGGQSLILPKCLRVDLLLKGSMSMFIAYFCSENTNDETERCRPEPTLIAHDPSADNVYLKRRINSSSAVLISSTIRYDTIQYI